MNYDISKWLKDELGLSHMSEADLSGLIFHPRHGSLCRRFVKFLAESTLCNIKYSNVYAKEEYTAAVKELESKNNDLIHSIKELEDVARKGENDQRELEFLKSRLSQMKTIQQLLRTHSEAQEGLANRPNFLIEQLAQSLDKTDYLKDSSLTSMYELDEDFKHEAIITDRQMSSIDDRLMELVNQIDATHSSVAALAQTISSKMNEPECNVKLNKVHTDDLIAIKIPPIEEEEEDSNQDEQQLRHVNADLAKKVSELDQQVAKLSGQYLMRKAAIRAAKSRELEECLAILGEKRPIRDDSVDPPNPSPDQGIGM